MHRPYAWRLNCGHRHTPEGANFCPSRLRAWATGTRSTCALPSLLAKSLTRLAICRTAVFNSDTGIPSSRALGEVKMSARIEQYVLPFFLFCFAPARCRHSALQWRVKIGSQTGVAMQRPKDFKGYVGWNEVSSGCRLRYNSMTQHDEPWEDYNRHHVFEGDGSGFHIIGGGLLVIATAQAERAPYILSRKLQILLLRESSQTACKRSVVMAKMLPRADCAATESKGRRGSRAFVLSPGLVCRSLFSMRALVDLQKQQKVQDGGTSIGASLAVSSSRPAGAWR